jgi:indolepyruvate ferredoxin oxidoreductase
MVAAPVGSVLETIVAARIADLVAYQDRAYARRYAQTVARCREAEETRCRTSDGAFASTVAVQLHRLMAYRDEYEVARLHRSPVLRAAVAARFGPGARVRYHLRPPALRRLGLERKVALGRAADVTFGALTSLRRLRGTPADPFGFGRSSVRRLERQLRDEYQALVIRLCDTLEPETHELAVAVARLPSSVGGYGPVKVAAIRRFWTELKRLYPQWAHEPELADTAT